MMLWVFGTTIFTMIVYWSVGGIYTFMDLTNRPACLRKYKIQPGTNEPVEAGRLMKVELDWLYIYIDIYLCHKIVSIDRSSGVWSAISCLSAYHCPISAINWWWCVDWVIYANYRPSIGCASSWLSAYWWKSWDSTIRIVCCITSTSISLSISSITNGQHPYRWQRSIVILSSIYSAIWCHHFSVYSWWAATWPPPGCGLLWPYYRHWTHTLAIICPSFPALRRMIFIIWSEKKNL